MRKTSVLLAIVSGIFIRPTELLATFNNLPGTVNLNENNDTGQALWTVSATCYPSNNTYDGFGNLTGTTLYPRACESCTISYNPPSGLFSMSVNTVYKSACSDTDCGNCPSCTACSTSNGCFNGAATYSITVTCSTSSYDNNDSGTSTLTVNVASETPTLTISLPGSVSADNSMSVNTVLTTAGTSTGLAIVEYTKSSAVANTYQLNTANMFELNTTNGDVYVATDPALEFDYTYDMRICIHSRRQSSCETLTINFDGCFQTPNCDDQTNNGFSDQFAIGDTLFTMTYDNPSDHFTAISPTWQNLTFTEISSTLSVASIHSTTGNITTTGNVTVWPDYPHSNHTFVVEVTNPGHSCSYYARCTMNMQFSFTNWNIRFDSLPATTCVPENGDDSNLVHSITTIDYNNPLHDNVTCRVVENEDDSLLELKHEGNFSSDGSWTIYKKRCREPDCGYIEQDFLCNTGIGCLNYDLDREYTITINCSDAYGSSDVAVFTLCVEENQPPAFTNTPTTITLNTNNVAALESVFSVYYSDAENEELVYNFTIAPASPSLFAFGDWGNYHDSPVNVTTTIFQWDLVNTSFAVSFCGRERRNIVCSSFDIDIREYCGPTPVCSDASTTVTDQFAVGAELFQIDVTGSGYTNLTYVIISEHSNLFSVNSLTGSVTSAATLEARNPPDSTTYSIVAKVYDTAACTHAACSLSVEVTLTNFDISIDNMGSGSVNVNIHEDTTTSVTLVTIETSDDNTNDGVTCEVDNAASSPANNSIFSAEETDIGSNVYDLVSKENPGFDYDLANTYEVVVVCEDNYGSSDTATATVSILENQVPTMDNLNDGKNINVDPTTVGDGDVIFTLQTSDDENDPLVYSCNTTNSFVPFQCLSDGVVSLRRDVRIPDEDGAIYNVTLCIEDSAHNHTVCKTLYATITSSKTNPVLNNLPSTVSFNENSAVGTTLFTVSVQDPDAVDVHTFSMTVYPKTSRSVFSLDATTGVLTLQQALDYETLNHYEFLFSVRDAYLPGLEDKYLNLSVLDVNEAPTLTLVQTTYDTIEENTGYIVGRLNYMCIDVDVGQMLTLSIASGTYMSYFSIDSSTGIMTYAQDWDFENGADLPETTSLGISCDDGNGLSDAGNIVVNIAAVNEYAPALNPTAINVTIYSNQTLFDPLFTVTATDNDFGDDGLFEYSIVGEGKGSKYFTLSSTGQLFISNYTNWKYNATFEFTLLVSDGEIDSQTSYVNVIVTYETTFKPPIPTKEGARCILCTKIGKAVVAALCIEGFIVLLLFAHVCIRMQVYTVFGLKPKPRIQTVSDIRRAIEDRTDTDDPYRPGSEMFNRALPDKRRPPAAFMYNAPAGIPAPAEYLPPKSAISLAHISVPTEQKRFDRNENVASSRRETIQPRARNFPSLFQNKAYEPPRKFKRSWYDEESSEYEFSTLGRPAPPGPSPLFGRPDDSLLHSANSRHLPESGEHARALRF